MSRVDIAWATLHSAVSLYVRARVRKDRSFIIENTHCSYEIRTSYVLPYYVWKLEQSTHTAEFSCHVVGHGPALEQIARDSANASCIVGALLANQVLQFARHHACCARPSTCGHQLWTGPHSISFSPTLRTRDEKQCLWCLALVMSMAALMIGGPKTQGVGRYAAWRAMEFIFVDGIGPRSVASVTRVDLEL